jgi:hypothetical protein
LLALKFLSALSRQVVLSWNSLKRREWFCETRDGDACHEFATVHFLVLLIITTQSVIMGSSTKIHAAIVEMVSFTVFSARLALASVEQVGASRALADLP